MVTPLVMLLLVLVTEGGGKNLGCRDGEGKLVDWYVAYKLPELKNTTAPHVDLGLGYLFFSSAETGKRFIVSNVSINDPSSFPGQTLKPIYDDPTTDSLTYAFYNDVHPDGTMDSVKGHTKGVVAFEDDGDGFWMIHSVPGFPPAPSSSYSYPDSGRQLGQSFLCVTLPFSKLETVATQLLYNDPSLYASKLSSQVSNYSMMTEVINGNRSSVELGYNIKPLLRTNMSIISFAKTHEFGNDLYHDLVAPHSTDTLFAGTHVGPISNTYRLASNCSDDIWVLNVQNIDLLTDDGNFMFNNVQDNSKWAMSNMNPKEPWVCIGDIDRIQQHIRRSGGTVCLSSASLYRVYQNIVSLDFDALELCNRRRAG